MKKCPNCQAELADDIKYCTNCGHYVGDVTPKSSVAKSATEQTNDSAKAQANGKASAKAKNKVQASVGAEDAAKTKIDSASPVSDNVHAQSKTNFDSEQAKVLGKNYFKNVLASWRHPSYWQDVPQQRYFGIVSFIIIALLNTLTFWAIVGNAARLLITFFSQVGRLFDTDTGDFTMSMQPEMQQGINAFITRYTSGMYVKFFLLTLIVMAIFVLCGYVIKRYLIGDTSQDIFNYINEYAYYVNAMMILSALTFVLALLGIAATYKLILAVMALGTILFNVGFFMATSRSTEHRFDKVYSLVIAQFVLNFVLLLFVRINLVHLFQALNSGSLNGLF